MKPVTLLFAVISCNMLLVVDCEFLISCGDELEGASCETQTSKLLNGTYFFFGTLLDEYINVYNNATISFGDEIGKRSVPYIAALKNADLECTPNTSIQVYENIGGICSDKCRNRIMDLLDSCGTMDCSHLTDFAVISWKNLLCNTEEISIQVALVRDSSANKTYTILLYETTGNITCKIDESKDVVVEINAGGECNSCVNILRADNIFNFGSYVYRIDKPENEVLIPTEGETEMDDSHQTFSLSYLELNFVFFSQLLENIYTYSDYGSISFDETRATTSNDLRTHIAGFNGNLDTVIMYYNSSSSKDLIFTEKKKHIKTLLARAFDGIDLTDIFLFTWRNSTFFTFQIALVSNSHTKQTYALLLYDEPRNCSYNHTEDVKFGFSAGDICPAFSDTLPAVNIINGSNIGEKGAYVYRIDEFVRPINEKDMFEYGDGSCYDAKECLLNETALYCSDSCKEKEDCEEELSKYNEDLSNTTLLDGVYTFYNRPYNRLFVCENGLISFDYAYCPRSLDHWSASTPPLVAGFLGHVNTTDHCDVSFKELTNTTDFLFYETRHKVMQLINNRYCVHDRFEPTHIFLATWRKVRSNYISIYFLDDMGVNNFATFQIALVTEAGKRDTYAVFLYNETNWDQISNKYSTVGFTAGDGRRSFTHRLCCEKRLSDLVNETNCGKNGAFVYRIDGDEITDQDIILEFVDDTPRVSEKSVTAKFHVLHNTFTCESIRLNCALLTNDDEVAVTCDGKPATQECSDGFVSFTACPSPHQYKLRVVASNSIGQNLATLTESFHLLGSQEGHQCGVNFINTGTNHVLDARKAIEFTSVGGAQEFNVSINNEPIPETSYDCSPTPRPPATKLLPGEIVKCSIYLNTTNACSRRNRKENHTLKVIPTYYNHTIEGINFDICFYEISRKSATYKHMFEIDKKTC